MKVIILAGGLGKRLSEETKNQPKPMVKIGGIPILIHIMNIYSEYGVNEFIIALGYKGEAIKQYFDKFEIVNIIENNEQASNKSITYITSNPNWKIHLVDTGLETMTGGRLKRLKDWLVNDDIFLMTYGDGVADINIRILIEFHKSHGKLATITAVNPQERFGRINFNNDNVIEFNEKPKLIDSWINGGFFVLHPKVINYIEGDDTVWESEPLEKLAKENQLMGYKHHGFWSCMDTSSEQEHLDELWNSGKAKWNQN